MTESAKIISSDGILQDEYGTSVALSGHTLAVGAPMDDEIGANSGSGAVFIYEKDWGGAGTWGQLRKIHPTNPQQGDQFGQSVDLEGDTLVVGAYQAPPNLPGKAYVFERNMGGVNQWGQVAELTATNVLAGDRFGWSVALSGDRVAVGSPRRNGFASNVGAVYLYERHAGGSNQWGFVQYLMPVEGSMNLNFGESIDLQGDRLVVGAVGEFSLSGSAYIYERNQGGDGQWGLVKNIMASDFFLSDQFGKSVSLDGDTIVVGAYLDDTDSGGVNSGSAYIFEKDLGGADQWGELKQLTIDSAVGGERFGSAVRILGDDLLVGAVYGDGIVAGSGVVYRYERHAGGTNQWGKVGLLASSDGLANDEFGSSLALNEDWIWVGAPLAEGRVSMTGAAYLFHQVVIPPEMTIQRSGTEVVISWEPATPGFILQGAPVIDPSAWTNILSGGGASVVLPAAGAMGYFRMIRP